MTCDHCHEDWPADFFCEVCSQDGELRETRVPAVMWDYLDGHDYEDAEEYFYYSTCLNCCPGHGHKSNPNP